VVVRPEDLRKRARKKMCSAFCGLYCWFYFEGLQ
jgi:hypothetical protein